MAKEPLESFSIILEQEEWFMDSDKFSGVVLKSLSFRLLIENRPRFMVGY